MSNLVNDLLRLATIEANQETIQLEAVDWRSVIQDAVARQHPKLSSKNIELKVSFETEASVVRGNANAMSHILDNLLANAILYTPAGGKVEITVRTREKSCELLIRDNGIGISKTDQTRIFERFFRVDQARTKSEGGTGLGLAIVKHLVMQLQGSVDVESELGQGTTFIVRFAVASKDQDYSLDRTVKADAS
jgi:two-component system phosphate regulon sensor histidine kinase PhoR